AMEVLSGLAPEVEVVRKIPMTVFRPQPRDAGASVHKEGDTFIVVSPELERIVARVDMASPEVRRQLQRHLSRLGANRALERAGVKPGDKIRCGNSEWEW
ncbi:Obg family GTPase CgtA, partial [Chloroflexota bacterium]